MLRRIALVLALALPAASWAQTLSKTLPNGPKIIVKEDHRAPVIVSQIWYKIGSVDEKPGKSDLSHTLERMMFKGTKDIPSGEFNRRVFELGGQDNAYTNRNETVYYENIAAANLPEILKLEVDRMHNLNFSDKEFPDEINAIREERRQRTEDTADGKMWEQAYLAAFTQPSMRASVIGYMKDLHILKADDLRAWYKQYYTSDNTVLVTVGDVDVKQTLQTAAKLFGDIPAKAQPPRNKLHTEPYLHKPVTVKAAPPVARQPLIAIDFRVPKLQKLDGTMPFALDILSNILADNASSRFDKNLVCGKQTALSARTHYDIISRKMPLFSVIAMPAEGVKTDILIAQLRQEIKDIIDHSVSEEELQRVEAQAAVNEIYAKDSMSSQASTMGRLEAHGFQYTGEQEIHRRPQAANAQEVQAAARMLTGEHMSTVIIESQKTAAAPSKKAAKR